MRRRLGVLLLTAVMLFTSMDLTVLASEPHEIESTVATDEMITTFSAANESWLWPVSSSRSVSQKYTSGHPALDIAGSYGCSIAASKSGTVYYVYNGCKNVNGFNKKTGTICKNKSVCSPNAGIYMKEGEASYGFCNYGYGNGVVINHGDGTFSMYAHMASVSVTKGQTVTQGQQIGTMGSSGMSSGTHCHFELCRDATMIGKWVQPGTSINNSPSVISYIYNVAPTPTDTTPPVISNVRVVEPYRGGYNIECDVTDNVGVARVEFPTWTVRNGQDDLKWHKGTPWRQNENGIITYKANINTSDHNNEQGYYITHIYAYDTAGNQSFAAVSPDTCVDWTNPTISDIKITDQTDSGYTVQCRATDNVGVSRVRFPVWTDKNGQDDIWWGEGIKNGNIYSFRVNRSDHNHEYGVYHNHIYAYDAAGNQISAAAPDCIINSLTITKQPDNYIGTAGETAVFRIAATGNNVRYQWQYKTAESNDWTNCNAAGSTTPELRFPIAGKQNDQMEFRCVVADSGNTVISQTARLSVINDVKKYTVTFDSQGGTLVEAITNIVENTKVVSLPKPPVRENFTFIGWYTEPNGQGSIFNENTIVNGDMTVYAYWRLQTADRKSVV